MNSIQMTKHTCTTFRFKRVGTACMMGALTRPLMIGCLLAPNQLRSGKLVTVPSIDVNEWLGGSVSVVGKSDRT